MPTPFRETYDFLCPPRILFGWGRRRDVGLAARTLGRRAFLLSGCRALEDSGVVGEVIERLGAEGIEATYLGAISREPQVADVDAFTRVLRERKAGKGDMLLALGGGSALDLAKACSAMATNAQSPTVRDYLEGVGKGLVLAEDPLPLLAMPTTAGTGSEATKNAVISSFDPPFKKSIRDDRMVPRVVLVDPELTVSVPPSVTAATGMDAITQLMESYISLKAAPIPQALALHGLALAGPSIVRAFRDGADRGARERMSHAALLSGMALANSGLGLAHGVAAALGVHANVPHGLACAVMLPVALRVNRDVREAEIARLGEALCDRSFGTPTEGSAAAVEKVEELCEAVGIPKRLRDLGVRREQLPAIVEASHGSSLSGNPRRLTDGELGAILESIL
jgi:alcohol dehydrogenase class IV